jgi:hypothetical protein
MAGMLDNVKNSEIVRTNEIKEFEAMIKAYAAETQRISAVQAGMTFEQIQDIVMGTVSGMITSGDLVGEMPGRDMMQEMQPMPPEGMPPPEMMPPQGMPQ